MSEGELLPADLDGPRYELIAKAYHLVHVQGHTVRFAAERLGVAPSTAWSYASEGRAQAALLPWLKREEVRLGHAMALRAMRSWLNADAAADGGKALEYVPILLKVMEREAKMMGVDAPTIVQTQGDVAPDPRVIAAIEAAYDDRKEQ